MLHGALPAVRAYLAPALQAYSAGYYEEANSAFAGYVHSQQQHQHQQQQHASYQVRQQPVWIERAETPYRPLDLSLKPADNLANNNNNNSNNNNIKEAMEVAKVEEEDEGERIEVEVDDEEDRRSREEARSRQSSESRYYSGQSCEDEDDDATTVVVDDDLDGRRSCSSAHSAQGFHHHQPDDSTTRIMGALSYTEAERLRLAQEMYSAEDRSKLLLLSPVATRIQQQPSQLQDYHQLLQTPQHVYHHHHHALTPPSTPSPPHQQQQQHVLPSVKQQQHQRKDSFATPTSGKHQTQTPSKAGKEPRAKKKHARRLKFDEDMSSPVSGTVILGPDEVLTNCDIDPALNKVVVNDETRAELAKIENKLGPYECKLCRQVHADAFQLAQHRCSRIANVEYRCPECDKRFSCPANLASHRRWHKPRPSTNSGHAEASQELACSRCGAKFNRPSALKKHLASQHPESSDEQNNNNNNHSLLELDKRQMPPPAAPTPPRASPASPMEVA